MFPLTLSIELLTVVFEEAIAFWTFKDLSAPYWRLYSNLTSGAYIHHADHTTELIPGFAYLIPPETAFSADHSGSTAHLYLHFTVGEPYDRLEPGVYPFRLDDEERAIRDRLARVFKSRRERGLVVQEAPVSAAGRNAAAGEAAALIFGALARFGGSLPEPPSRDVRIDRLIRSIDEARGRAPANRELSEMIGMNEDSMIRLFKAETGETPARWSLRRRIDRACVLLSHSERTIKEIAGICGFSDRNYFTTAFARWRGKPPAQWRKEQTGHRQSEAPSQTASGPSGP